MAVNIATHLPDMDGLLMLIHCDCVLILQLLVQVIEEMLAIEEIVENVGGIRARVVSYRQRFC